MATKQELTESIKKMIAVANNPKTKENIRKILLNSIEKAENQLKDLEKAETLEKKEEELTEKQEKKVEETKTEAKELVKSLKSKISSAKKSVAKSPVTTPTKGSKNLSKARELARKYRMGQKGVPTGDFDIERDASRPAMPKGKRIAKKSGKTYYENRENRIDRKQPPKTYPKLEKGGLTGDVHALTDEFLAQKIEIFLKKVQPYKYYFIDENTNTLIVGFDKEHKQDDADKFMKEATSSMEFFDADSVDMQFYPETGDTKYTIKMKKDVKFGSGGKMEYGGILLPMTGGVNADPRFDIYDTGAFMKRGGAVKKPMRFEDGGMNEGGNNEYLIMYRSDNPAYQNEDGFEGNPPDSMFADSPFEILEYLKESMPDDVELVSIEEASEMSMMKKGGYAKKEYGGILQPMTGGVNADPRFDIYSPDFMAKGGGVDMGKSFEKLKGMMSEEVIKKVDWKDADYGDSARVISENKMGLILKPYGQRFHLKFPDGTEKTYSANELEFYKEERFASGGETHNGNLEMLKNQSKEFKHHAEELQNVLKGNPKVDAWVVAKSERANTDLSDITHYLDGAKNTMAKGGVTEHGLKEGDEIIVAQDNAIVVLNSITGESAIINIETGTREDASHLKDQLGLMKYFSRNKDKNTLMADGGKISLEKMYEDFRKQSMMVRSKIALLIGIDKATKYLDRDYVVNPFNLIESAVRKGFITIDEINQNIWDASVSEAEYIDESYKDSGQGISGSDMNAFISRMLNDAGIKVGVKDNTYQRMAMGGYMADGGNVSPKEKMIKELQKLQRELNSSRLSQYREGDTSEQEMARQRERDSKLARFNEILEVLNEDKKMAEGGMMAEGGKVKFADKVASIKKSLLERKKVPKAVQKDYGKTFSPKEAEDSAKRIVGAKTYAERIKYLAKKNKK